MSRQLKPANQGRKVPVAVTAAPTKKSNTKVVVAPPVSSVQTPVVPITPVAVVNAVQPPVKATQRLKKLKDVPVTTTTATPVVTTAAAAAEGQDAGDTEKLIEQRLQDTIEELKDLKSVINGLFGEFIDRLGDARKEIKKLRKTQRKQRPPGVKPVVRPSTFEIEIALSPKLEAFLEVPTGTKMSRNEVTSKIHRYCKNKGLLQEGDQRIIHPDEALRDILSPIPDDQTLTYFNLQRFLKHNYV